MATSTARKVPQDPYFNPQPTVVERDYVAPTTEDDISRRPIARDASATGTSTSVLVILALIIVFGLIVLFSMYGSDQAVLPAPDNTVTQQNTPPATQPAPGTTMEAQPPATEQAPGNTMEAQPPATDAAPGTQPPQTEAPAPAGQPSTGTTGQ